MLSFVKNNTKRMNNPADSWSRCAKEFPSSDVDKEIGIPTEFTDSIMRPVHVKRLDFNNGYSSCGRGLVANDIALASLEEIERNELVAKWIEDGMCTPPISEQNTSYPSSPLVPNLSKSVEILEEETFPIVTEHIQKSPILKTRSKRKLDSKKCNESLQSFIKSPKIGKRRRSSRERRTKLGPLDKRQLNDTESSSPSDRSPLLGKGSMSSRKHRPRIKRKRLQDQTDFDTESYPCSLLRVNQTESILRLPDGEKNCLKDKGLEVVAATEIKEEIIDISQDIFDEEIITASPRPMSVVFGGMLPCKTEIKEEEFIIPDSRPSPSILTNNEHCPSPVTEPVIKTEVGSIEFVKTEQNSFHSFVEDTEEFILPNITKECHVRQNLSEQSDKFLIFDSEFSIEKQKFVTDTERIDYETSSENEEGNPDLILEKISAGGESDSDKTASDIIEEPTTQDYLEPLKQAPIITLESAPASPCSRKTKISETVSPRDLRSPQISFVNISVETTPPQESQESFNHPPELLDSAKKKKSRPKKGSLGARLQKLISGQVSCVRLWRHQMTRESALERSSAPCTTLLVIEAWVEYGKNMHKSVVVDDPYDLLNDYFDESGDKKEKEKKLRRNLVVMTNPDFVGSVKLPAGSVFRIYLPWQVFDRNLNGGNLILDALYFEVVSHPGKSKSKSNADESGAVKDSDEIIESEVSREYRCPCLVNGKIDDSCSTKFTNHKIDIIDEIVRK